ncbi:MAG: PAS domain-containing protein, partial [Planctomycetaceae bacterium]|nr:PAS domain-containing protein [Planctomycetaceae bacterium]
EKLNADLETLNWNDRFLTETVPKFENTHNQTAASPQQLLNQISPLIATMTQHTGYVLLGEQSAASVLPAVLATEERLVPLLDQYNASLTAENNLTVNSYHKFQLTRDSLVLFALSLVLFCAIWFLLTKNQKSRFKLKREKTRLLKLTRVMKDNQQKLSAAISAAFHETWSWSQSTGEFWCSETFWQVFGYQNASQYPEATFDVFRAHIDPEQRGVLETALQAHLEHGTPIHLELLASNEQGESRWVRVQAKLIAGDSNGPENIVGTVEDIHDYKLTQLQLDRKETLLTKVGMVARIGGWHVDLKTNNLFWTSETYTIHEVDPDYQPTIETGLAFYAPEARPLIQNAIAQAIETGEPWDLELPFITAKGRHIWVRTQGELEYENKKPVRLVGAFQDISHEKQREIEFLMMQDDKFSSCARLEGVISAATEVSIIATNPQGIITLFSPGAERLLGYTAEEMIGSKTPECFHLAEEVEQRGRDLTASLGRTVKGFEAFVTPAMLGGFDQREWTYIRKDG